jgi:hypothetical protein
MESLAADQLEGRLANVTTKLEGNPLPYLPCEQYCFVVSAATVCDCIVAGSKHLGCF